MAPVRLAAALTLAFASLTTLAAHAAEQNDNVCNNCFEQRWVYFGGDLSSPTPATDPTNLKLIELIGRAKRAGYNGIALNTSGHGSYASLLFGPNPDLTANLAVILQKAKEAGIELIPVGGGPEIPALLNPDLLEALPVKDTPFIVQGNRAVPLAQSIVSDSGFEQNDGEWHLDGSGGVSYDTSLAHQGQRSVKFVQNQVETARIERSFANLKPHKAYRMSFWLRTEDYDAPLQVQLFRSDFTMPLYNNRSARLGWGTSNGEWNEEGNQFAKTQGWTQYNLDFNTADETTVHLSFGHWGRSGVGNGAAWLDDLDIREIGLAHTVDRAGLLPVVVRSEDGSITYVAGIDYLVAKEALVIKNRRLREGTRLRVSYYQSAQNFTARWATPASACNAEFFNIQRDYYDKINALFNTPSSYFLYYDEIRVLNWDPACGGITAGKYLANTTRKVQADLLAKYPALALYIWNDMFDPNMNALDSYWLAKGSLAGAVEGLHPNTVVVNWTDSTDDQVRLASLKFFSDRKLRQMIAGYYDEPDLGDVERWLRNLDAAEKNGLSGVQGFMYTTWQGNDGYDKLEAVAETIKQKSGRWVQ
ncbi:hypothetical protein ACFOLJ_18085 [Rugamonas sp. CCM 8940]|uniref:hypothetical protein n=1 Tax=Rugamonas sp. CCM 8940 TaxID=2765359 RepID=UPI0018F2C18C|nr:hypothetical protein [Rugamonas sp. CCM 8940]MBJ7313434.1 hypothetical protein [Rugamonas sp. CCM 8940]